MGITGGATCRSRSRLCRRQVCNHLLCTQRRIVPTGVRARGALLAGFGAAPLPGVVAPGLRAASLVVPGPARRPLGPALEVGELVEAALTALLGHLLRPVLEAGNSPPRRGIFLVAHVGKWGGGGVCRRWRGVVALQPRVANPAPGPGRCRRLTDAGVRRKAGGWRLEGSNFYWQA